MLNSRRWLLFVLLGSVVVWGAYYLFPYRFFVKFSSELVTEEQLPEVKWSQVRRGQWAKGILQQLQRDKTAKKINERFLVEDFTDYGQLFTKKHGNNGITLSEIDWQRLKKSNVDKKPYVWAGFGKTMIEDERYILAAQVWPDKKGNLSIVIYAVGGKLKEQLGEIVNEKSSVVVMPKMVYIDQDTCQQDGWTDEQYCYWWKKKSLIMRYLLWNWQAREKPSRLMVSYPVTLGPIGGYYEN